MCGAKSRNLKSHKAYIEVRTNTNQTHVFPFWDCALIALEVVIVKLCVPQRAFVDLIYENWHSNSTS